MYPSACPEHGKLPSGSTGSCPDCAWRPGQEAARTSAPFDADGRPDKFHSFSGARDAAETPNPPRMSRAERLRNLREML